LIGDRLRGKTKDILKSQGKGRGEQLLRKLSKQSKRGLQTKKPVGSFETGNYFKR